MTGTIVVLGFFLKFYAKSIKNDVKDDWQKQITDTRNSIETKHEKEFKELKETITRESSTEAIKAKVRDFVEGEIKLMEQDVRQIKELTVDLKQILSTQQETLIAIQMSITELKPRITSLEKRVAKLEDKDD